MKRIFALLLCLAMVFAMAACGDDNKEPSQPQETPGTTESTPGETVPDETTPDDTEPSAPSEDTIRENGQLPEDEDDLTSAEMQHYIGKVMQAIIELDVETMNELASDNSAYIIRSVKDDEVYGPMWEKTVGQSVYLEESHMLVYKDPEFIFASWMTDAYSNGETLKASLEEYTEEELIAVFDKYAAKAPYVAVEIDFDDFDIDLEEGKIKIDCNECFAATEWDELSDIGVPHATVRTAADLGHLLFGAHSDTSLGLDYISAEGFSIWNAYITGDLAQITAAIDASTAYDMNAEITDTTNQLMEMVYQHYYKDADKAAAVQAGIDENVMILRDMSTVLFYIPAELNDTYPYYTLTDTEKAQLADVQIYIRENVHRHEANSDSEVYPFYQIVAQMARLGAIDWMSEGGPA